MAITNLAQLVEGIESGGPEDLGFTVTTVTTIAGKPYNLWVPKVPAGAAPTTAVAPTRATTGALGQQNGGTGQLGVACANIAANGISGVYMLVDILSHQGGLVGNVTTSQATNLPTAALTRYTSGVGVMMGLTIYTQIGTTGSSVTVTYTDTADASSTAPAVAIGATGFREANRMIMVPLASGDLGVKAVTAVQINTTSTGTAGAIGVTLFKPLYAFIVDRADGRMEQADFVTGNWGGGMPEIVDGACLSLISLTTGVNPLMNGSAELMEW